MNPHSLPPSVQALVAGVQELPFHVCVYVDTVAVAWSILNVEQFCVLVLSIQDSQSSVWYPLSQLSNLYNVVHGVHVLLLAVYGVHEL